MRFEASERVRTTRPQEELLSVLEQQFRKISEGVRRAGQTIEARSIEASFGSINRSDTTTISLREADDGWLVVAEVHYRPSVAFWIILILTLFTWVLWLLPIAFYLIQRTAVRTAISEILSRVKNEFDQSGNRTARTANSAIGDLEKLGALKEKGFITGAEFDAKKKELLGI